MRKGIIKKMDEKNMVDWIKDTVELTIKEYLNEPKKIKTLQKTIFIKHYFTYSPLYKTRTGKKEMLRIICV